MKKAMKRKIGPVSDSAQALACNRSAPPAADKVVAVACIQVTRYAERWVQGNDRVFMFFDADPTAGNVKPLRTMLMESIKSITTDTLKLKEFDEFSLRPMPNAKVCATQHCYVSPCLPGSR